MAASADANYNNECIEKMLTVNLMFYKPKLQIFRKWNKCQIIITKRAREFILLNF